jgi:peptidase M28-like protein
MDTRQEIVALTAFRGRWPGTDAERRAARHLQTRLEELGREAEVEGLDAWPDWPLTYAIHAQLAVVGSVLSVYTPVGGAVLVLVAVVLTALDATGLALTTRRLLGRRASQNVISREDNERAGTLVLVAHYDAGRGGAAFGRKLAERVAVAGQLLRRPIGPLEPLFWAMLLVLLCTLLRIAGIEGLVLTTVQFVPTVLLILALPLLVDVALSDISPGANDNASGVATALQLAERYGGRLQHFDLWVLLTGAQEAGALGMRAFLRHHRRELERERTVFVNLDEVGAGTVRYTVREGLLLAPRSHVQLARLCDEIAEDDEDGHAFGARPLVSRTAGDGAAARAARFPAITIRCRNALDYSPEHHQPTDTPEHIDAGALERAYGFSCELIERLDAGIGPDLERGERDTTLTESERT